MDFAPEQFVLLVKQTPLALPDVRRRALMESVRRADSVDEVVDIFLEAATSSPYVTPEQKSMLANSLLDRDFAGLAKAASCGSSSAPRTRRLESADDGFCKLARLLFSHSRKLQGLPVLRRRKLMFAVHLARTEEQVVHMLMKNLPTALSLNHLERQLVATDVLDKRYYRLLLPDRFDCKEPLPRTHSSSSDDADDEDSLPSECPICLEELEHASGRVRSLPCCRKTFCASCITQWSQQSSECPLCRANLPPSADHYRPG